MVQLFRFITGYVRLEAQGGLPERLISLAAQQEIPLWNTARQGISLFASCPAASYRQLRPLARRSGMRMRVRRRVGLPFLLRPLRLRWGLAVGTVAAVALLMGLSSRVWVITVEGNRTVPDTAILQVLEPLGIKQGASFAAVDIPQVQLTALQELPQLSWLAVNQSGSTVTVQVQEKQPSQPIEEGAPANVVAAWDGVIVRLEVTDGQAMVQVGDAVTAGTLLISGVTDSKVGPLLRRASGRVLARTTQTLTVEVPLSETVTLPAGRVVTRPSLVFFGWRIPLYTDGALGGEYTPSLQEYPLCAGGKPLPVGLEVQRWTAQQAVTVTRTADEAAALALERLAAQETQVLADTTVDSRTVRQEQLPDRVVVTATYVCTRDIGRTEVISTK